jgi:hypothetical protein
MEAPRRTAVTEATRSSGRGLWPAAVLAAIAALAAATRWVFIDFAYMDRDESFSWRMIQYSPVELIRRTAEDVHPPYYYLVLKGWAAAWGSSLVSMRALSVVFGVAAVLLVYVLVLESLHLSRAARDDTGNARRAIALFVTGLMALHVIPLSTSRMARMHSLGVFLAVLTSWLLLRALRSRRHRTLWWGAYAAAAVIFLYTHYYAGFTLLAQGVFVLVEAVRLRFTGSAREARTAVLGIGCAGLLTLILYSPWLPVLRQQLGAVSEDYWIEPLHRGILYETLYRWATGLDARPSPLEAWVVIAVLGAASLAVVLARDRAGHFFLLQMAAPWVFGVGYSVFSGSAILQIRYLEFAHVSMLGLFGVVIVLLRRLPLRIGVASALGALCVYAAAGLMTSLAREPPTVVEALRLVQREHRPGDLILVGSQKSVNRLRYYARSIGFDGIDVRCVFERSRYEGGGSITHIASLDESDLILDDVWNPADFSRIWRVFDSTVPWRLKAQNPPPIEGFPPIPDGMRLLLERDFDKSQNTRYVVTLHGQ